MSLKLKYNKYFTAVYVLMIVLNDVLMHTMTIFQYFYTD